MKKKALLVGLVFGLSFGLVLTGCGSKKPGVSAAASVGDEGEGTDETALEDGLEPEADTGAADYPEPTKRSAAGRNPAKFKLSVKKAHVLPLSEDGQCWDACSKDAKNFLVDSLTKLSGDKFISSAKNMTTAMGAKGTKEVLPDIYLHINCGFGQEYTTSKVSAENRLAARWLGAKEILKLDAKDECAISVWDADDDGNDEMLGSITLNLLQKSNSGEVIISSDNEDLGQVVMIELFLDQLTQASTPKKAEPDPKPVAITPVTKPSTKPEPKKEPDLSPDPYTPKTTPGVSSFRVEIVKANLKAKKDDGQNWDTKIPFIGKDGILADPFIQGYVNGYKSEHPFMETSTVKDKLYHVWNETGKASLKDSDKIHFMVWDKDKLDHDLIGECITDTVGKLNVGSEIVIRNCAQVDFLVIKITNN
ncbi:MAG: hypothetical protein GY847_35285 [Proteobacteria bacterium]|nr:hypothetical protein [Pseudomonadota bacterium]